MTILEHTRISFRQNLSKRSLLELTSITVLPSCLKFIIDIIRDSVILAVSARSISSSGLFFDQLIAAWIEP
jgi:hypothetical protein